MAVASPWCHHAPPRPGAKRALRSVLLLLQLTGSLAPSVFDSIQKDVAADDGPKVHSRTFTLPPRPAHSTPRGHTFAWQYSVQLLTGALRMPASTPSVVMTKKGGKKYRCYLPEEGTAGEAVSEGDALEAAPSVASYLMPIKGTCFYRLEGWWTYEFCFLHSGGSQVAPGVRLAACWPDRLGRTASGLGSSMHPWGGAPAAQAPAAARGATASPCQRRSCCASHLAGRVCGSSTRRRSSGMVAQVPRLAAACAATRCSRGPPACSGPPPEPSPPTCHREGCTIACALRYVCLPKVADPAAPGPSGKDIYTRSPFR